ncbi:hypothetical protein [Phycicoccus avicenniae]|uniref:hypothetical protein n=1 Tax=Phycicoccus avicenniae TaxID=2828860 RepID=UPI003D2D72CA
MDGEGGADDRRAEGTYVSTDAVIAREVAAVVGDIESTPGYWRPFVRRHALVTALFVGVLLALGATGYADRAGVLRATTLALVVMAGLTALDGWQVRRRLRGAVRAQVRGSCPPGTPVSATWTSQDVVFRLPSHEVRLLLGTVSGARVREGVLLLDQPSVPRAWSVPVELLGADGLPLLRTALGARLHEPL